jgi:hypothetical protein
MKYANNGGLLWHFFCVHIHKLTSVATLCRFSRVCVGGSISLGSRVRRAHLLPVVKVGQDFSDLVFADVVGYTPRDDLSFVMSKSAGLNGLCVVAPGCEKEDVPLSFGP